VAVAVAARQATLETVAEVVRKILPQVMVVVAVAVEEGRAVVLQIVLIRVVVVVERVT
jgi:hypothetical protein